MWEVKATALWKDKKIQLKKRESLFQGFMSKNINVDLRRNACQYKLSMKRQNSIKYIHTQAKCLKINTKSLIF